VDFKRESSVNEYELAENPEEQEDAGQSSEAESQATSRSAATSARSDASRASRSASRERGSKDVAHQTATASSFGANSFLNVFGINSARGEKPGSARKSMSARSNQSQSFLGHFGTFAIKEGHSMLSARSLSRHWDTERGKGPLSAREREDLRQAHRRRRGLGDRVLTVPEIIDSAADGFMLKMQQEPCCFRSCMDKPAVQAFCFPAEYATQNIRSKKDGAKLATSRASHANRDAERRFGLPEFSQAGYCLVPPEETPWADTRVPMLLGLTLAIHRKTSIERLCFAHPKRKIPAQTSKDHILSLVRMLKRCDHVNILKCHEMYEDAEKIYLMYEIFPAITLLSVLEKHKWNQVQVVNLVRELCATVAYASAIKLDHLGWSLGHVLMPVSSMNATPDPAVAKVFGFGLHGVLYVNTHDQMCWAPEAMEAYHKLGESFILKMEPHMKAACDSWSLGTLIYTLVARRPPILGSPEMIAELIIARKWAFTLAFDEVDDEARTLVESLLTSSAEHRHTAAHALRNEWIRRRSVQHTNKAAQAFVKVEEFVHSPLPKRLFGRFLVRFLDADHFREVASKFAYLDANGDGVLCEKDLLVAAKLAGKSQHQAHLVSHWLCAEGAPGISMSRFAESMAEDVIDGRALRHSFESLDDDGSEFISAEELFESLCVMDPALTQEQVLEHIAAAEGNAGADDTAGDHRIDFDEFEALFPVRVERMKKLQERKEATQSQGNELGDQFDRHIEDVKDWIDAVEHELHNVIRITGSAAFDKDAANCVKQLTKHFKKISDLLRRPPGKHDEKRLQQMWAELHKQAGKDKKKKKKGVDMLTYDSFVQDEAFKAMWPQLIAQELRMLKQSIVTDKTRLADMKDSSGGVDHCRAHDASEGMQHKVEEVLKWVKQQFQEYQSFVDVFRTAVEPSMPRVNFSGRGLQKFGDEADDDNPAAQGVIADEVEDKKPSGGSWDLFSSISACAPTFMRAEQAS